MSSTERLTDAERIAEAFGIVLGAASCNEQVSEERLNSVAGKARHVVLAAAEDAADAEAAKERFSAAIEAGGIAAETGRIDPEAAETALSEIEAQLAI